MRNLAAAMRALACAVLLLAAHAAARAQVIDLPNGDMFDTQTGLTWVGLSPARTWAEAAAVGPHVRLVTSSELLTLFDHVGVRLGEGSSGPDLVDPDGQAIASLIQRWGCVLCTQIAGSEFWLADPGSEPGTHLMAALFFWYDGSAGRYRWSARCCSSVPDDLFDEMATGAVRVLAIPEPQTWSLLLLGGAWLATRVRRTGRP
jgi:hypothetical protein